MQLLEGQLLAGRYRLLRELGGDATFQRWLAADLELDSAEVEIAMLPSAVATSRRSLMAVKTAAIESLKLLHTNIAATRAFSDNDGAPFIVFDHVEGRALSECLDEWGKLSEAEAKSLLTPLGGAIDYAHAKDIIHKDIRPSNIIVAENGTPYLLGFCTAREAREAVANTQGGNAAGPISWMSPEQLLGKQPSQAQDIYSFAAIAYECISGHPPFYRGQVEYQILNGTPEPLAPETPFTRAVMRALSKNPEMRPASCEELFAGDRVRITMPEVVSAVEVNIPKVNRPQPEESNAAAPNDASGSARFEARSRRDGSMRRKAPINAQVGWTPPQEPYLRVHQGMPGPMMQQEGTLPPLPPHRQPPPPPKRIVDLMTEEERRLAKERRDRQRAEVERRRSHNRSRSGARTENVHSSIGEDDIAFSTNAAAPAGTRTVGATRQAIWIIAAIGMLVAGAIIFASVSGRTNTEMANAPVRKTFSPEELGRFSQFQGIEFGKVIPKTPEPGDSLMFGASSNKVVSVSIDGKFFEVELAQPVFKVFPRVRISLVDTSEGRRISSLTFEKNGEGVKAAKASKVVKKIASLIEDEYGIDMGNTLTAINDSYFGCRYSDDFIDIRISSVVSPDSTSISFSIENRAVRASEIVVLR